MELDPENTVESATPAERQRMRSQKVPSFRDYLTIAKEGNQIVIWDFKEMELTHQVGY